MALPYFYVSDLREDTVILEESTSKHIVQVLRMEEDEQLLLTDGKGQTAVSVISDANRKRCTVRIQERLTTARNGFLSIAISPTKNASRFEWFLEKATEIGVGAIIPILCKRTERSKFRTDRWNGILQSAMLQSQQAWMPQLHEPAEFTEAILQTQEGDRYIAHCLPQDQKQTLEGTAYSSAKRFILIGPEGDFTAEEVELALAKGYMPVSLGATRLRTETAGVVAAVLLTRQWT
jgi:16S rRNA (uracil1498-N3)-methyltransferase